MYKTKLIQDYDENQNKYTFWFLYGQTNKSNRE